MKAIKKVLIFLSGRGSNCRALIQYQKDTPDCGFEIIGVITDKPGAAGLYYAKEAKIPIYDFFRADFPDRASFLKALFSKASELAADFYVLAGFMVIVPEYFISEQQDKIINIHPSLLPEYPGLKTHERALADKKALHGCTVHFVNETVDGGAIISQATVAVLPDDSPETLGAKVLKKEHVLYPWVLTMLAKEEIASTGGTLHFSQNAIQDAKLHEFVTP